jgi:hypothetical protein
VSAPDGVPSLLPPGEPTLVTVRIFPGDEQYVEDSGLLHYRYDGGTFQSSPLVPLGDDLYQGTLPPAECNDTPEFYFSAEGTDSGVVYDPAGAPSVTHTAEVGILVTILADDFETDQGWNVQHIDLEDGHWERGIPVDCDRGDPPSDYDGSGQCYLTHNDPVDCNSDVDGGPARLLSPVFNLSGVSDPVLSYARWFTNDDEDLDRLNVEISNDGGTVWHLVESVSDTEGWVERTIHVADYVTPSAQVALRFGAMDNPNDSVTEAAVDAFNLFNFECGSTATTLAGASSCATHASLGEMCLDVGSGDGRATGDNIEPRLCGGAKMAFETIDPVDADTTQASVSCAVNPYVPDSGYPIVTADGSNAVTVEFSPPLPDADCCTISLTGGIEDEWSIRLLGGDVDFDGAVLTPDASRVKSRFEEPVTAENCWYDLDCDGQIVTADASKVKSRFGNTAPACP